MLRCGLNWMRVASLACALALGACASGPPAISGPVLPPGLDHGRIEKGAYHDKRDWYSVSLPFQEGEAGYDSLSVSEEYPSAVSYAAFIPTYTGGEYYRSYVEDFYAGNRPVPALPQLANMAVTFFGKVLMQQRLEPMRLVEEKPWNTDNSSGYLRLYTQKAPETPLLANLALAEDYTAYILLYVAARGGKVAVIWAEWPVGCEPCQPVPVGSPAKSNDPMDQAMAMNARAARFIASFRYVSD